MKKKARLEPGAPVADAWSRAVEQERTTALDWLCRQSGASAEHAVHQARRVCKRLRALLQLAEPKLGEPVVDARRWVAAAGRALAPGRDATVRADTLSALLERYASALDAEASQVLAERFAAKVWPDAAPPEARSDAVATLEALQELLADAGVRELSRGDLLQGVSQAYRRARQRWRKLDAADVDAWHALRSAAKVYANQLRALRTCTGGELRTRERQLGELAARLGAANDRAMLRRALEQTADEPLGEVLAAVLRQEELGLHADAAVLAAGLFEERPRELRRALRQAWVRADDARAQPPGPACETQQAAADAEADAEAAGS